jgi:hypothetical protein
VKTLLGKLSFQKVLGLFVGEREVTLSQVAATPLGPVELARRSEPYEPDQLGETVTRLVEPFLGRRKKARPQAALGLPTLRVFFSTRPIRTTKKDPSPQVLLHEVLQSPTLSIDDMAVDLIRAQPGKRKVASIVSCRKKYLNGLMGALGSTPLRLVRAEPAPCALLRVAALQLAAPRRARTVVRVFLGAREALAVAVCAGLPLVWRAFALLPGREPPSLASSIRSLHALLPHCGVEGGIDALLIHGRADLHERLESEVSEHGLAARLLFARGPELADTSVAFGLALGCLGPAGETFDLAHALKPRARLRDLVPWGELAVQAALLVCMALFLLARSHDVDDACRAVQGAVARQKVLKSAPEAALRKEKKDLEQQVEAIRTFLAGRVLWSAHLHELSARLPTSAPLMGLQGQCELERAKKGEAGRSKKSLVLKASAPITPGGSTPREIDDFVGSLRGDPLLQKDFPLVELADIRWQAGTPTSKPLATFTVVCLPKDDRARPRGKGAGAGP